jgi:hypothetical protein
VAGPFYFAWVDVGETTFLPEHVREDEEIWSFELTQDEGDFAHLRAEVRNPRVGLLSPSRKVWAWFSWDRGHDDPSAQDVVPLFFGRLVGIPSNFFEDILTLEFVARPADYAAQKEALADTLRELPHYDPIFVDEQHRANPDVVLEARPELWHVDRVTHEVSVSGVLLGEDGTEIFGESDIFEGTLQMNLNNVPLTKVRVDALMSWTQRVGATVDLTDYIVSRFPSLEKGYRVIRTEYNGLEQSWPKTDARLGDGWIAKFGQALPLERRDVQSKSDASAVTTKFADGSGSRFTTNSSYDYVINERGWPLFPVDELGKVIFPDVFPPALAHLRVGYAPYLLSRTLVGEVEINASQSRDDDGRQQGASTSTRWEEEHVWSTLYSVRLVIGADPDVRRRQSERVTFTLEADVQPVVTLPEEEDQERIEISSVDIAGEIDGASPLPLPSSRTYLTSPRGQQSIQYLLLLARARLLIAARAVELTAQVPFERIADVTLRKSAQLEDPRLPGGAALGKMLRYAATLSGDDGQPQLEITVGCTVGRDGTIETSPGQPTWASEEWVGNDWQEFTEKTVVVDTGLSDVGFIVPLANPQDDGLNFEFGLSINDILKSDIVVLSTEPPTIRFSLVPLSGDFESPYEIDVSQLKVPRTIDLEEYE